MEQWFRRGSSLLEKLGVLATITAETETGCRELEGYTDYDFYGYPIFQHSGEKKKVARWLLIAQGEDMTGKVTRHTCANRACINTDHLLSGTQEDNMHDMDGMGRRVSLTGSDNASSKLTEDDVKLMRILRLAGMTVWAISRHFGISKSMVYAICRGKWWRQIPLDATPRGWY